VDELVVDASTLSAMFLKEEGRGHLFMEGERYKLI